MTEGGGVLRAKAYGGNEKKTNEKKALESVPAKEARTRQPRQRGIPGSLSASLYEACAGILTNVLQGKKQAG